MQASLVVSLLAFITSVCAQGERHADQNVLNNITAFDDHVMLPIPNRVDMASPYNLWPRKEITLEYMETPKNGKAYTSLLKVNSTKASMTVLENYSGVEYKCFNTSGTQKEVLIMAFKTTAGFLVAEAGLKTNMSSYILVTNNAVDGCNALDSRGYHSVTKYLLHEPCHECITVQATKVDLDDFADFVDVRYGLLDTATMPLHKRQVLTGLFAKRQVAAVNVVGGSIVASSPNINGPAVVAQLGGQAALGSNASQPGNLNMATIPTAACGDACQTDIVHGLDVIGLLNADDWSSLITHGLENAMTNPAVPGQDAGIQYVLPAGANVTDLQPSQVVAVDAANPQITKRAVLPADPNHRLARRMHNQIDSKKAKARLLVKRGFFDFLDPVGDFFNNLINGLKNTFSGLESTYNDVRNGFNNVKNSIFSVEAEATQGIENAFHQASSALQAEVSSIGSSAASVVSRVASVAAEESNSIVSVAQQAYASASKEAVALQSQAAKLQNQVASEAASVASRASVAAQTFLEEAKAQATKVAQVVTVISKDAYNDLSDTAINFATEAEAIAKDVANGAGKIGDAVAGELVDFGNDVVSTYNEVTSEIEKALGEHSYDFSKSVTFDVSPGASKMTPFQRGGVHIPGFPIDLAGKEVKGVALKVQIDAYLLDSGFVGAAAMVGHLVIDILHPSRTAFLMDLNLDAMLNLELGLILSGSLSYNATVPLGTVAIPALMIPGIVTVGPDIKLEIGLGVYAEGSIRVSGGVKLKFTKASFHMDLLQPSNSAGYNLAPAVTMIYPKFEGSFKVILNPFIRCSLEIGINILNGKLASATAGIAFQVGLGLQAQGNVDIVDLNKRDDQPSKLTEDASLPLQKRDQESDLRQQIANKQAEIDQLKAAQSNLAPDSQARIAAAQAQVDALLAQQQNMVNNAAQAAAAQEQAAQAAANNQLNAANNQASALNNAAAQDRASANAANAAAVAAAQAARPSPTLGINSDLSSQVGAAAAAAIIATGAQSKGYLGNSGAVSNPGVISKGIDELCHNGVVLSTFLQMDIYAYYGVTDTAYGGQYSIFTHVFPIAAKCFSFDKAVVPALSSSSVPAIGSSTLAPLPSTTRPAILSAVSSSGAASQTSIVSIASVSVPATGSLSVLPGTTTSKASGSSSPSSSFASNVIASSSAAVSTSVSRSTSAPAPSASSIKPSTSSMTTNLLSTSAKPSSTMLTSSVFPSTTKPATTSSRSSSSSSSSRVATTTSSSSSSRGTTIMSSVSTSTSATPTTSATIAPIPFSYVDSKCARDNCLRGLLGARVGSSAVFAACTAFQSAQAAVTVSINGATTRTITPSAVSMSLPTYAAACSGAVRYASACQCQGISRSTVTVSV